MSATSRPTSITHRLVCSEIVTEAVIDIVSIQVKLFIRWDLKKSGFTFFLCVFKVNMLSMEGGLRKCFL